ncbi:hypothetical protein, partial [Caballeronia mineralivorans]|uniref:hypothetical protein n=1 Tax=Caballeronia mineralivorans TaxID=2010198 RepID=UPI0023F2101C
MSFSLGSLSVDWGRVHACGPLLGDVAVVICALRRRPVCELESFADVGIAVLTSLWQGIARCTIYMFALGR